MMYKIFCYSKVSLKNRFGGNSEPATCPVLRVSWTKSKLLLPCSFSLMISSASFSFLDRVLVSHSASSRQKIKIAKFYLRNNVVFIHVFLLFLSSLSQCQYRQNG